MTFCCFHSLLKTEQLRHIPQHIWVLEDKYVRNITQSSLGHWDASMIYLKHEHECFIRYKTRGAAECFISDKGRMVGVFNSFKNDPFYTHLVTLFTKDFSI